ncbi:MAG: hypothetical protein IJE89_05735 [Bacilli bacterium]|nr:hypothetical protein [Bacilli bacterium]
MEEIRNKRLTLFLLEILLVLRYRNVTEYFVEEINEFIYQNYKDNKELFSLFFDYNILEQFIEQNYQVLPNEILIGLLHKYRGFEGYESLVDEVGMEVDQKISILVMKFIEYHKELIKLRFAPSNHPRILQ